MVICVYWSWNKVRCIFEHVYPDSKVHGANMGPTWVLSAPDGPHVGPMNLTIRVSTLDRLKSIIRWTRIQCVCYPSSFSEDDGWIHMSTTWRGHTLSCPLCYRCVVSSFEKNAICYLRGHQTDKLDFWLIRQDEKLHKNECLIVMNLFIFTEYSWCIFELTETSVKTRASAPPPPRED